MGGRRHRARLAQVGKRGLSAAADQRQPGEITLIAIGEPTYIAALLKSEADLGKKFKAIALLDGSIRRSDAPSSKPEPDGATREIPDRPPNARVALASDAR